MELIYLWVEEYKNIQKQGFNFSPRFTCKYDDEKKELTIDENKEYVSIFPENINVTAIVGENGSGKSTILELLKNDYDFFHLGTILFIYFDERTNQLVFPSLSISPINIDSLPQTINIVFSENITLLQKTKTIFFTHLFHDDYNLKLDTIGLHHTKVVNLSSIYELADGNIMEVASTVSDAMRVSNFSKIFRTYSTKQIQKAVLAIKSDNFKLPFDAPQYLKIKQINAESILKKIIDKSSNDTVKKICKKLLTLYEANVASWRQTGKTKNLDDLGIKMILAFILEETTNTSDESVAEPCLQEIELLTDENNIQEYVTRIYTKLSENDFTFLIEDGNEKLNAHFSHIKTYFEKTKHFLERYNEIKSFQGLGAPISHSLDEVLLDIKENDFEFLKTYLELMNTAERFLEFSWINLSSGEENFLYQFSRFYYLKNHSQDVQDNIKNIDNLVILFDEGEITLHPQWQKQYIHYCVDFFQKNFADYQCNLIFTTHSPFILSDLPKENVVFLKKGKQVYPNIETFGANIHTLLSHGFFMQDGLMGEFAKEKINEVIKYINDKDSIIQNDNEAENIIKIIGEPILKSTLKTMFDEKKYKNESKIDKLRRQRKEIEEAIKQEEQKAKQNEES